MINKIYEHITIEDLLGNNHISEESFNFCLSKKLNTLQDIILFHKKKPSSYYSKFGAKIFREFQKICNEDEDVYQSIFKSKHRNEPLNEKIIRYQEIIDLIEDLSEQERELLLLTSELIDKYQRNLEEKLAKYKDVNLENFAVEFYERNGYLPMFWILEQYLINDNSREIDILINSFKLFSDSAKFLKDNVVCMYEIKSLEEIAEKYRITRERARQIRNNVFRKTFEISDELIEYSQNDGLIKYNQLLHNQNDWNYTLDIVGNNLNQESFEIQECLIKEQCNLSAEFALHIIAYIFRDVYSIFGGFEISSRDRIYENTFLISKEYADIFNFEKFIEVFQNHILDNETEYDLDIENYLTNSNCWSTVIDLNKFDDIVRIVKDFLLYEFQLYSNLDGLITIPAMKKRNPLDVVYEILQRHGSPMHLDEIFKEFKNILPEHKYSEASQLRSLVQRHEAISFRNRKSVYTLKEWKHIKSGTIRDAIVEFLLKCEKPKNVDEITNYVLQFFPKTNNSSIRTTMLNDTKRRFSFFRNNLFGLVSKEYPPEYEESEQQKVQRKSFEQRLYDLEKFISDNDHFPFSTSDDDEETSLCRWWRLQCKDTKLSEAQKADIERIKTQYADYESDKIIYEWYCNLNDFKFFVIENGRLPSTNKSEKFLYGWFRRAKDDFNNQRLNEKQRRKYSELFKDISYAER